MRPPGAWPLRFVIILLSRCAEGAKRIHSSYMYEGQAFRIRSSIVPGWARRVKLVWCYIRPGLPHPIRCVRTCSVSLTMPARVALPESAANISDFLITILVMLSVINFGLNSVLTLVRINAVLRFMTCALNLAARPLFYNVYGVLR